MLLSNDTSPSYRICVQIQVITVATGRWKRTDDDVDQNSALDCRCSLNRDTIAKTCFFTCTLPVGYGLSSTSYAVDHTSVFAVESDTLHEVSVLCG